MDRCSQIRKQLHSQYAKRKRTLIAALAAFMVAGTAFWICLPDPLFDVSYSSVLFDRKGKLMGAHTAFSDEQLRFPPVTDLPEKYIRALIEFEDKRFKYHPGVDPLAMVRALVQNLKAGRTVSGGSTISMQVIRLSRKNPGRTYLEKLKEAVLTLRLELRYSKREILRLYASHAPFGGNVVGIEAASWRYFGRAPEELTWAESALLAILPNSPSLIHPGRNRSELKGKRDRLLQRMHRRGLLSQIDLKLAVMEPLPDRPHAMPMLAPHLLDTLKQQYPGKRLYSTVKSELQKAVTGILKGKSKELCSMQICNAAAVIIDNQSFEVLAYVGNSFYDNDPERGYAIDMTRRPRSTGSILKPFLFAAMLQSGDILPTTLVPDIPTQYEGYQPENYDRSYRGAVPAREALALSLNVPAVRMLRQYGVERFYEYLKHLGMSTLHRPSDDYGLTLILGGAEVKLWDLAAMYANLANIALDEQEGRPGNLNYLVPRLVMDDKVQSKRKVEISMGSAWLTLDALLEVVRPGEEGYWQNFSSARKIAWKTGTSYGLRDGWAIGNTSKYTVAVWVGNADGTGVAGLTGASSAAPLLFEIFGYLDTSPWFPIPYKDLQQVTICKNDGFLANADCETGSQWAPEGSNFQRVSTYNRRVHLDRSGQWQVHGGCEAVSAIVSSGWFVLPASIEYFYRRHNPSYKPLPQYRKDCLSGLSLAGGQSPLGLLYPGEGTQIYIPVDLDGQLSEVVFEAVHRESETAVYWHLDEYFLGSTRLFHQMALKPEPGNHLLILVDELGNRLERSFEVLAEEEENMRDKQPRTHE